MFAFAQGFAYVLHSRLKFGRAVLVAGLLALALGACGRKGPLEAPPNATGAIDLPDSQIGAVENEAASLGQTSVLARPPRANRAITVPEKPFLLDPIL
jgi:predicted small lipoprotein YifL